MPQVINTTQYGLGNLNADIADMRVRLGSLPVGTNPGGLPPNKILLYPANGGPVTIYEPTQAGLVAALAAAVSGDFVKCPRAINIAVATGISISAGVILGEAHITFSGFSGTAITLADGANLIDCPSIVMDGSGQVAATVLSATAVGRATKIINCSLSAQNATTNKAVVLSGNGIYDGPEVTRSYVTTYGGTNNYAADLGDYSFISYCYVGAANGSTNNIGLYFNGTLTGISTGLASYCWPTTTDTGSYGAVVAAGKTGRAVHCYFEGVTGGLVINTGSTLSVYAVEWSTISNSGSLSHLPGDFTITSGSKWYDVTDYGADGTLTNDDAAVAAIVTAMPATGGVMYFPAGDWPLSPTTFTKPIVVIGDGSSDIYNLNTSAITVISTTSATGVLFNFNSQGCSIRDVVLLCTAAPATAGSGITAAGDQFSMERVKVQGFYDNVVMNGAEWNIHACYIAGPRHYGILANNSAFSGDFGDWSLSDTVITTMAYNATAALHYTNGGGGKIVNSKINGWLGGYGFVNGIEAAFGTGVGTSILLVSNCSIENLSGNGVDITTSGTTPQFDLISIVGCEFGMYIANSSGHAINIAASNLGEITQVIIDDCNFRAGTGGGVSLAEAINLVKINNVALGIYTINANWTGYLAQSGCTNVVQVGTGTGTVTSIATGTGLTGGPITTTGTISDANTGVAAATYGDSSNVAQFAVNAQGRITSASNVAIVAVDFELLMADGVTNPPIPLETEAQDDWLYGA